MPNPYHDAEGKFCSRNEMATAIDQAVKQGDYSAALSLRQSMDKIDAEKIQKIKTEPEGRFYEGKQKINNKHRYAIAGEGLSGVICMRCKYNLTSDEAETAIHRGKKFCPNCKAPNTGDVFLAAVVAEHEKFFDPAEVQNSVWYHATTTPDWHETMLTVDDSELLSEDIEPGEDITPLVHLGSAESAQARAYDLVLNNETDQGPWYLHEIRLKPETEVAENIIADENEEAPGWAAFAEESGYSANGVTRYLNVFESAGHISLVANARCFEVVGTKVIDPLNRN